MENRKFSRLTLSNNRSQLRLEQIPNKATNISVKDISLNGLRFISNLNLPTNSNFKYHIDFSFNGPEFALKGNIVWQKQTHNGFEYGFQIDTFPIEYYHALENYLYESQPLAMSN
ncbi:PilZ domain-containing protein [Salirhabdus salicampi]|uniref:PilZ domain-containing protein n=1 Tax=Salirhabdus salicampi TaxID=476102 RepID=UPI0020C4CE90|nr:PilZ domain-containing protein [Salirhabdus salicampi]MCP8615587.1 PilZ domain-containing protein [Salirhabdus salicampi]